MASVMIDRKSHPHLWIVVNTVLEESDIKLQTPQVSCGTLDRHMLHRAEMWLHVKASKFSITDETKKWCCGREPCIFPAFSDAMEIMNGQDQAADIVLLMHMAREGDL